MAQPPYSTLFGELNTADAGEHDVYTVPDGFLAVLRDVDGVQYEGDASIASLLEPGSGVQFAYFTPVAVPIYVSWRGRQVFNPGQTIAIYIAGGGWQFRLSGYLLLNP